MSFKKTIITARDMQTNDHIFIQAKDFSETMEIMQKLHKLELKENRYTQIRMRASIPDISKGYRWISLVKWFGA